MIPIPLRTPNRRDAGATHESAGTPNKIETNSAPTRERVMPHLQFFRFWHFGQKCEARPATRIISMAVPQCTQAAPVRP